GPQPFPGQHGPQPFPGQQQQYPGQPYPGGAPGGHGPHTGGFSRAGSPVIRQRNSALPDPPPGAREPGAREPVAAIETDNIGAFARDLRVLRSKAGLDYPDMAEKSHYTMRTLASAAGGLRLPTLPVLIAYVNACGGDVAEWEDRWSRLTKSGKKAQTALPAGGEQYGGQLGQGRIPQGPPQQSGEIYVITSARQRDTTW
ncbi:MAG TPA: helix-turn-helix transcriptional regulator, partial [Trebonia sp.]|nr:helix-turn-helix transcriptional regulator [Trebonia sp.]